MLPRVISLSLAVGATAFSPAARPAVFRVAPVAAPAVTPAAPVAARVQAPVMFTGLEGPAVVSAAWVLTALNFMPLGPTANMIGATPAHCKWGDRTFLNMIEQAPLFLVSLWLHAVFVSAEVATGLGFAYLGFRFLYPVIWAFLGKKAVGAPFPDIFYCTFPQYGIAFYMALATVLKLSFGFCLNSAVKFPLAVAPIGFGWGLWAFALKLVPILQKNIFAKAF